jgi:hypothetical protein
MGLFQKESDHRKCIKEKTELQDELDSHKQMLEHLVGERKFLEGKIKLYEEIHPDLKKITYRKDVSYE